MKASTSEDNDQHHLHERKKRVGTACDLCRVKKTKCDGKKPCSKCIADNKICAFTERKKLREKSHSSGYIDLLETRVDLLTRSLEKVVAMAEPYVPALKQIIERSKERLRLLPPADDSGSDSESVLPINDLVSLLISDLNILERDPSQRETGNEELHPSRKTYIPDAQAHQYQQGRFNQDLENASQKTNGVDQALKRAASSSNINTKGWTFPEQNSLFHSFDSPASVTSSSHLLSSPVLNSVPTTAIEEIKTEGYSRDGLFNTSMTVPDLGQESSNALSDIPNLTRLSIFGENRSHSNLRLSLSSITNRLESQTFEESLPQTIRRLHSTKTHMNYSSQKRRASGHIHKPLITSHTLHSMLHSHGDDGMTKSMMNGTPSAGLSIDDLEAVGGSLPPLGLDYVYVDDLLSHAIENRNIPLPGEEEYLKANPLLGSPL